jgi:5'-nucleotidase
MTDANDQIALFDLDGSLADYDKALRTGLDGLRDPALEPPIPLDLHEAEKQPHLERRMRLLKSQPDFWYNLDQMPVGFDVFKIAQEIGFINQVLTKGPWRLAAAWTEKVRWCQRHLGQDVNIHILSDDGSRTRGKGLVYGKVFFDDYPPYMTRWLDARPRGLGIMPLNRLNQGFTHPRVLKVSRDVDYSLVQRVLRAVFERQGNEPLEIEALVRGG